MPPACDEYCEASLQCGPLAERGLVQQPANAWSSLAFVAVGLWALGRRPEPTRWLFVAASCLLGGASFLFHATLTRDAQWLDMVGTYTLVISVAARGAVVAFGRSESIVTVLALALAALLAIFKWSIASWLALPALCLLATVPAAALARAKRVGRLRAMLPAGLAVSALAFRQLDVSRALCWPNSLFQAHAVWHLLNAAAALSAFQLFEPQPPAAARRAIE